MPCTIFYYVFRGYLVLGGLFDVLTGALSTSGRFEGRIRHLFIVPLELSSVEVGNLYSGASVVPSNAMPSHIQQVLSDGYGTIDYQERTVTTRLQVSLWLN
jgi:hypothetical protein